MTTHPQTAAVTAKGRALAERLSSILPEPSGWDQERARLGALSLIGRHAVTYTRIQEIWCSVDLSEIPGAQEETEKREQQIERRISALCESLGQTVGGGSIAPLFRGDPRGYCVSLVSSIEEETHRVGSGWDPSIGLGVD